MARESDGSSMPAVSIGLAGVARQPGQTGKKIGIRRDKAAFRRLLRRLVSLKGLGTYPARETLLDPCAQLGPQQFIGPGIRLKQRPGADGRRDLKFREQQQSASCK